MTHPSAGPGPRPTAWPRASSRGPAAPRRARARGRRTAPGLRELAAASAAVADALRRHGVRPGQAVAVCLPRSWRLVCAMLGVLRLGAVVVPLDALSPPERRRHILTDSAAVALVHGAEPPEEIPEGVTPFR
ncbi:AMP-binding protein [Streptomyces sp. M19]